MAYIDGGHLQQARQCNCWQDVLTILNEAQAREVADSYGLHSGMEWLSLELDFRRNLFKPTLVLTSGALLRYYNNPDAKLKMVDFLGGWEADMLLTNDFDLILSMAKEFFRTGDVKSLVPQEEIPDVIEDDDDDE